MHYDDRLVAFLDVLGFRALINETVDSKGRDQTDKIQAIHDAFDLINKNWTDPDGHSALVRSKSFTIFSDTVVVSVEADEKSQIFHTLLEIKHLIMGLVGRGLLVRGAIVRGKLIHDRERVFGPALIEAYVLESKAALYPRVIIDRDLVEAAGHARARHHSAADEVGYVRSLLEQDSDGMYYIDYFYKAFAELDDPENGFPAYINSLGDIIRKGLMGSTHPSNADLRVKYSWMRERYNKMVETVVTPLRSRNWELEDPTDLEQFYLQLKKISPGRK